LLLSLVLVPCVCSVAVRRSVSGEFPTMSQVASRAVVRQVDETKEISA